MPLQNRVTPWGEIVADPGRGLFTGNRGILHDDRRCLTGRRWTTRAWITCVLDWKGRRRVPMTPGTWTELFFLDEAAALAAGHRPCAYCRRADYRRYQAALAGAFGTDRPKAPDIDGRLHAERLAPRPWSPIADLPDGCFVEIDRGGAPIACLSLAGQLWPWTAGGYGEALPAPRGIVVTVLTPALHVGALSAGYRPVIHPSAGIGGPSVA